MKQVYPWLKRSWPFPFPLEDCSFPRSRLSDLTTLGLTTVRSRKKKVLSRKRNLGLDLSHSGIYLFPALQNIYSKWLQMSTKKVSYCLTELGQFNFKFNSFANLTPPLVWPKGNTGFPENKSLKTQNWKNLLPLHFSELLFWHWLRY